MSPAILMRVKKLTADEIELDLGRYELRRRGRRVKLEKKPMELLIFLVSRHKSISKVAMGRRLAIRLYWMWRNGCEYSPSLEFGSYAGQLVTGHGGK